MNLKQIDAAIRSYNTHLDEFDGDRLSFFREIWEEQARLAAEHEKSSSYTVPDEETLVADHQAQQPILTSNGVAIDKDDLVIAQKVLADVVAKGKGYPPEAIAALLSLNWDELDGSVDLALAGANPGAFIDAFYSQALKTFEGAGEVSRNSDSQNSQEMLEKTAEKSLLEMTHEDMAADLATLVTSLALRTFLEGPASQITNALREAGALNPRPCLCPVCGSEASVARIGDTATSRGSGRELWCSQCGCAWEFERIRCARCGTQSQDKLHFFNIEGDDAHRIAVCEECGDYIRTLYQEDALAPFSYDVEDVVMARLDYIALNQMQAEMETLQGNKESQVHSIGVPERA